MLGCGHDEENWYSICSRHQDFKDDCPMCNVGRCIRCYPKPAKVGEKMRFFQRDGTPANPFPHLGVRVK